MVKVFYEKATFTLKNHAQKNATTLDWNLEARTLKTYHPAGVVVVKIGESLRIVTVFEGIEELSRHSFPEPDVIAASTPFPG